MATGFVWHERYMWHDTGTSAGVLPAGGYIQPFQHFENPDTKRRLRGLLEVSGLLDHLVEIKPRWATEAEIGHFHTPDYIERIKAMSAAAGGDAGELTPFGSGSYEIALLSTGGCLAALEAILEGKVNNAYALVRPPGHHAEASRGRGFCIFGNVAITVMQAQAVHGLKRVATVDWDVHHGNGTQKAFYKDPTVLTISIHQDQCYPPGSGLLTENGAGAGEGANLNINLPPGAGHAAYVSAFERVVVPALRRFRPEIIIVPSGFDANAMDPLARMLCDSETYRLLTRQLMTAAAEVCGGRLLMCHEGGYSAVYVPYCGLAVLEELSGIRSPVDDPFLPVFAGQGGYDLLPHHIAAIDKAAALIERVPAP
ncbi:MAG: class II histone deacetylase [Anaerolineae bacterium]